MQDDIAVAKIKQLRLKLKMNTKQFGDAVGVSSRTVEDWEQGRRMPSKSAQILLARLDAERQDKNDDVIRKIAKKMRENRKG